MINDARRVRMLDVANSLGVSRATVSLVMRGSPLVSATTRESVLAEADRLGYVYNQAAASLRTQRNDVVGLVMPDIVNPLVAEISLGAQEVLNELGYFAAIVNTAENVETQQRLFRTLVQQRVAGVIVIPVLRTASADVAELARSQVPLVVLTRAFPDSGVPFVGTDDTLIGRMGGEHLVEVHGCREVAYFGGNALATPRVSREGSFRETVVAAGASYDKMWSQPFDAGIVDAYRAASALLEKGPPPRGILCHSDNVAFGLLKALQLKGYTPQDCAVVGIDDLLQSQLWTPSVSSIAVQPTEIGRVCARVLLTEIGTPPNGPTTPPPPTLHPRTSCGCNPTNPSL
ncbi:LacI family DNA-binding transcriptional regulator [Kribbella sp. NPDC051952]|uniref:LacI family DNA-binding transcriptional regulator n=1 Tax=Kribbella sp. NPDC051952 TaxID=3154851 RepID=UPI003423DEAD